MTGLIVAQPLAGAVLSKAMFRLIGTAVGAAVAVVLVPALVNAPNLLTMALAIWPGLCTYLSALDKSPRAYIFLLAGYTAGIVGFPSVARPGAVLDVVLLRGQEIGIGIVASALCHGLIFPQTETIHDLDAAMRRSLLDRIAELMVAHQRCVQIGDLLEVRSRSLPPDVQNHTIFPMAALIRIAFQTGLHLWSDVSRVSH